MQKDTIDYGLPADVLASTLPPLITIGQAEALGAASGRKLRKMCATGELRATKVGTDWRIARDQFFRRFGLVD
jgi:excisionase family DNA binding protein